MSLNSQSEMQSSVTLITIGTIAWIIVGFYFAATGAESKLIWTCVSGAVLGLWGRRYSKRRSARGGL